MEAHVAPHTFDNVHAYAAPTAAPAPAAAIATVFVIDSDHLVRRTLEQLIKAAGWKSESFGSAEDFLSRARHAVPCCVILDLTLPGLSGLDLQKQLAGRPEMPIIFMTCHTDVPMAVQAMKAGAIEFLTRPVNDVVLLHAIRTAIERSRVALRHRSVMQILSTCYASLTPREREVMEFVVTGLSNKQVGLALGISEATVKAHRGQVMRKMDAESLADLVTMATRLGLQADNRH